MTSQEELERIKRIREAQLRARDPQRKNRQMSRQIASKNKARMKNQSLSKEMSGVLSFAIKGGFWGFVIGLLVRLVLPLFTDASWAPIVGYLAIVLFTVLGVFLGSSFDWRDRMRDL